MDVGSERPVGQLEQPPHSLDQNVEADKDVVQEVAQESGGRVGQVYCRVTPAANSPFTIQRLAPYQQSWRSWMNVFPRDLVRQSSLVSMVQKSSTCVHMPPQQVQS